jgi:Sulfotransferase domain
VALEVVGAGWGRTGTVSLKLALEQLGFGPCYHMFEVITNPAHNQPWLDALAGNPPDWNEFLASYRSSIDWPASRFWRELKEANPDARVILTTRDPDAWYGSFSKTIAEAIARPPQPGDVLTIGQAVVEETFDGRQADRDHVLARLRAHEADVIATVPADELLVFDVADGWEPLCAFLGVDIPGEPFPRTNSTAEFRTMVGLDAPPS